MAGKSFAKFGNYFIEHLKQLLDDQKILVPDTRRRGQEKLHNRRKGKLP